jgi:hypothetical protein
MIKRILVVLVVASSSILGLALQSDAQSAVCSRTTLAPGGHISVTGDGATAGTTVDLLFNGSVIGATTADGFGNFAVGGNVPGGATPGLYQIRVTNGAFPGGFLDACTVAVEEPAAAPSSSPISNATSTATQAPAVPSFIPVPVVVQQQQQQQQQQLPAPVPEPRFIPVSAGRSTLPTTGANTGTMAQGGTGALIIGLSLVEFARRRKRNWSTASSSNATLSEGDLFLPYWPR